jgi:hypothetical protein
VFCYVNNFYAKNEELLRAEKIVRKSANSANGRIGNPMRLKNSLKLVFLAFLKPKCSGIDLKHFFARFRRLEFFSELGMWRRVARFQTKNPDLGKFLRALQWKVQVHYIHLCPFCLFYGYLVYLFPVLECCAKKNLANLTWRQFFVSKMNDSGKTQDTKNPDCLLPAYIHAYNTGSGFWNRLIFDA